MSDPETGSPHTAQTVYDVPLIVVAPGMAGRRLRGDQNVLAWTDRAARAGRGRLADIMPTLFDLGGIPRPAEMTGATLVV